MASKSFLGLFTRDVEERADLLYRRGHVAKAADLYFKAKNYGQAAALYAETGDIDRAVEVYREASLPLRAAELLETADRPRDAIALFEEAGAFARAAEVCLKLQQHSRAARLFEEGGLYKPAAEAFTKAGDLEKALAAWEREAEELRNQDALTRDSVAAARLHDLESTRADLLVQIGRPEDAAELLMQLGRPRRAAALFERAGRLAEATRAYLDAGMFDSTNTLLERDAANPDGPTIGDDLRLEILQHSGRDAEAGELLEQMGRFEEAATAYEDAMAWGKAARLWEKAELMGRAAELFFRVERYEEAGQCYAQANDHAKAGKAFALAGNDCAAADAYLAADEMLRAGEHYLKAGEAAAAQDALQGIDPEDPEYPRASLLLIPVLLEQGLAAGASHRLDALEASPQGRKVPAAARFYWRGRVHEARGEVAEAEIAYQKVLAERSSFRDTGGRLAALRQRSAPGHDTAPAPTRTAGSSTTGSVSRGRSVTQSGPGTAREALADTAGRAAETRPADGATEPAAVTEQSGGDAVDRLLSHLPFAAEERLEPWWPETTLLRVTSHRSKKAGLLLILPLDALGAAAATFRQEAARIQALDQASILPLEDLILTEQFAVLHFGSFDGELISRHLRGPWRPLPTSALNLLVQIGDALAAAHQLGMAHQWLSPNTLLMDDAEHIAVVGFGLHDLLPHDDSTAAAYLAPELHQGLPAGPAADVYSFGLLGVELLGALLPAGWSGAEAIEPSKVQWPAELEEVVPETIRGALLRCLARNPLERPSAEGLKSIFSVLGLVPGQVLQQRYEIRGELGRGGMSRVYRAYDKVMDEQVAIKTLLSPMLRHSPEEQRLLREVRICRKISHPNVVRVHDLGSFPGGIFITMELLDGEGLDEIIRREAPMPLGRVRSIARQIAQALGEAHRLDVVHRDLKPGNVFVAGDRAKVLDFGIARMGEAGGQMSMTRTGEVIGSPLYMAPEQIQGKPVDGTCDLYALGVIVYTLLAGREPFVGDSPTSVVYQHLRDPPPDIRTFRTDLPEPWLDLLVHLLAKKPTDRYPHAGAVVEAMRALPVES